MSETRTTAVSVVVGGLLAASLAGCAREPVHQTPDPPLTLTAESATDTQTVVVGTAVPVLPVVRVTDPEGNPVEGVRVVFAQSQNRGAIAADAQTTDAEGRVRVTAWVASQRAGPATVAVTLLSNASSAEATFHLMTTPGPPVTVGVTETAIDIQIGGQSRPLYVANLDQYGNPVSMAESALVVVEDTAIASITPEGRILGKASGQSAILVTSASVSAVIPLEVGNGLFIAQMEILVESLKSFAVSSQNLIYAVTDVGSSDGHNLARFQLPLSLVAYHFQPRAFPGTIAFVPDGSKAVALASGTLPYAPYAFVIDVATNTATDSVRLGTTPSRLIVSADGAFALGVAGRVLTRIDLATLDTASLVVEPGAAGAALGIEAHPTLPLVYVSNVSGWVAVVDYSSMTVLGKVTVGGSPRGLALTPTGDSLYVARSNGALQILDELTLELLAERPLINFTHDVGFVANGARLIVTRQISCCEQNPHTVRFFTRSGLAFLREIPVSGPTEIAIDGTGTRAVVLSGLSRIFVFQ